MNLAVRALPLILAALGFAVSACNLSTAPDVITVDTGYALINGESIACEFDGKTYDFGWVNKDEYLRQILVRRFNSDTATVKQRMQIAISGEGENCRAEGKCFDVQNLTFHRSNIFKF